MYSAAFTLTPRTADRVSSVDPRERTCSRNTIASVCSKPPVGQWWTGGSLACIQRSDRADRATQFQSRPAACTSCREMQITSYGVCIIMLIMLMLGSHYNAAFARSLSELAHSPHSSTHHPQSFTHALAHSLTHSCTHALTQSFSHPLTHSPMRSLRHSLTRSFFANSESHPPSPTLISK